MVAILERVPIGTRDEKNIKKIYFFYEKCRTDRKIDKSDCGWIEKMFLIGTILDLFEAINSLTCLPFCEEDFCALKHSWWEIFLDD